MALDSVIASDWSCVTKIIVTPSSLWMRPSSMRMISRSLRSRLDRGSSMRKTRGLRMIARPSATRWRSPPESLSGRLPSRDLMPRISATASSLCRISRAGTRLFLRLKVMFCSAVMCG